MSTIEFSCQKCNQSLEAPHEMIGETISCPACNSIIAVPPPIAIQPAPSNADSRRSVKECPCCGEEILASARKCKHCGEYLEDIPGRARPESLSPKRQHSQEATIWEGHPSALYYLSHWFLGVILLPFWGLGLLFIIYAVLDQKTRTYTHTTRKVIERVGIISRTTREVAIRDIKSINMAQSILERVFGLGTVEVGSAGTGGVEVQFRGIKNPTKVRDGIRNTKDEIFA